MTQQRESTRITDGHLTRDAVEALSRTQNEPAWLLEQRLAAWNAADQLPYPTGRERAWKYLNPLRLRVDGLRLPAEPAAPRLEPTDLPDGVVLTTLSNAVQEHADLVRNSLGNVIEAETSIFTALNAAFWMGGVFVHIPKDTKVTLPLRAVFNADEERSAVFPRLLLIAERGADVTLVDEHQGGEGSFFASSMAEFVLGDDANVRHIAVQRWGDGAQEVFFQRAELGRAAHMVTLHAALGGQIHKGWIESSMRGTGSMSDIYGLNFGTADQYFDVITLQDHIGEHTTSDLLIKSALKDRSQSAYYGLTRVGRHARMADANQEDRNLLLSDKAKAEADPVLEILTSEVARCAHGASAGPVDQEQLFYLECRGLPRPEAEKLLVQGFLGGVLTKLTDLTLREEIDAAIVEKLGA